MSALLAWELFARARVNVFCPPVFTNSRTFVHRRLSRQFSHEGLPSLYRIFAGYAIATLRGVTTGAPIGAYRPVFRLLDPFLQFLRAIPPSTIIPAGILILGIADGMKIVVICFGAVWPILVNAADRGRNVPRERLDMARIFGFGYFDTLLTVTLPSALPGIFAGLRFGLSIAFIMIVVSEMIGSADGLGYYILQSERTFAIPAMCAGIVLWRCSATLSTWGFWRSSLGRSPGITSSQHVWYRVRSA